jgi:hypothetical protein
VWDLSTTSPIVQLSPHYGTINSISITNDGARLITGSFDGTTATTRNLSELKVAVRLACAGIVEQGKSDKPIRDKLREYEVAGLVGRIGSIDTHSFLSFYSTIPRRDLESPIECGRREQTDSIPMGVP